jgi:hypothetical protein
MKLMSGAPRPIADLLCAERANPRKWGKLRERVENVVWSGAVIAGPRDGK